MLSAECKKDFLHSARFRTQVNMFRLTTVPGHEAAKALSAKSGAGLDCSRRIVVFSVSGSLEASDILLDLSNFAGPPAWPVAYPVAMNLRSLTPS